LSERQDHFDQALATAGETAVTPQKPKPAMAVKKPSSP